jgi:S-formylglutathione hydrolase
METLSKHACFGGTQGFYSHESKATGTLMRFGVFEPPQAKNGPVPVLTYLAGLTCNEETAVIKAGFQRRAAELGLMIITPDTSPRGENVPDDADGEWDFGLGAGFYINASEEPWAKNYRMEDYITRDLQEVVFANFRGDKDRQGIFGHSMGGHGALTLGLKYPAIYQSISAFAPICAPSKCPWGEKAFSNYLGGDKGTWQAHDASLLVAGVEDGEARAKILIDQGLGDDFLKEQLHPHLLEEAAAKSNYPIFVRRHEGYDHGYYFIQTFVADHLLHHTAILKG